MSETLAPEPVATVHVVDRNIDLEAANAPFGGDFYWWVESPDAPTSRRPAWLPRNRAVCTTGLLLAALLVFIAWPLAIYWRVGAELLSTLREALR